MLCAPRRIGAGFCGARARECGAVKSSSGVCGLSCRLYTPICQADQATDHLASVRHQDELRTLWARQIPVPSLRRAVGVWLRFGHDPVLHTSLPTRHHVDCLGSRLRTYNGMEKALSSPFAYAEDYMGTNLVWDDPEHVRESAALWIEFFERKFLLRLRQSRRTSTNFIGRLNAPDAFTDEADQLSTRWSGDTHFREMAYLSERHLKEKVTNPLQLEGVLWDKSDVSAFLSFFQAYQQETATRIPLPVPSLWVYDADGRKRWADMYLPVARAARVFFNSTLAANLKRLDSPTELLTRVAEALRQVHTVLLQRRERQQRLGIYPTHGWVGATPAEKDAWVTNEVERWQRSIKEGNFDPEDLLEISDPDTTNGWWRENEAIQVILDAPIKDCSFSLKEFWLHTIRREALETEHILEGERMCEVEASARRALYDSTESYASILEALEESIAKGWLDMRAAVFQPHTNPVWCALHYAKFGSASVVQHTNTASRQLLFYYAASLQEVAATARLYYSTKPRSEKLDYASPNTMRRSLTQLCAAYGLDMMHAAQRPILLSAANIAKAEEVIQRISLQVARPFGRRRRACHAQARRKNQPLLTPVSEVVITKIKPELLPAGADDVVGMPLSPQRPLEPIPVWPMGSRNAVHYCWPTPLLEELRALRQRANSGEGLSNEHAHKLRSLCRQGVLEISLWRRQTHAEAQATKEQAVREEKDLAVFVETVPELKEISEYAKKLYMRLNRNEVAVGHTSEDARTVNDESEENEEWVFEVMLDDRAPLNEAEVREVYLPFTNSVGGMLQEGDYRVRVRAYDINTNPSGHPTLCSEAFSEPFKVKNVLPGLIEAFVRDCATSSPQGADEECPEGPDRMAGTNLIALCEFLREKGGLDVPLRLEFDVGQEQDGKGTFSLKRLCKLLQGNDYHRSLAEHDITDVQRRVESKCRAHWSLYHAGADEEEWACARRTVLDEAMAQQRDWWLEDPMLEVTDVATGSTSGNFDVTSYAATMRYGAELCTVLQASGSTHEEDRLPAAPEVVDQQVRADCTVDGTGAIVSLVFGVSGVNTIPASLDQALAAALSATQRAQDRHRTLSAFKLGPMEKQAQTANFCGTHGSEMGGKYARTFCYALRKAKKELEETAAVGRRPLGIEDQDVERRSDSTAVDRFASDTHPEQRKKLFTPRIFGGGGLDDPTPDQTSTWGR